MPTHFVMERRGSFKPIRHSNNQCKVAGHDDYKYICHIVFDPRSKLDSNDFLIDHTDVHDCIVNCDLQGSCERMQINIMEALLDKFKKKYILVLCIRLTIIPTTPTGEVDGLAQLTQTHLTNDNYNYLALLP